MSWNDVLSQILTAVNQQPNPRAQTPPEAPRAQAGAQPPLGELIGQLFGQLGSQQQANLVNQLIQTLGPAAAAALAGGVLQKVLRPGQQQVTPEQASQLSSRDMVQVVNAAQEQNAELGHQLRDFFERNRTLLMALGGVALIAAALQYRKRD